MAENIRWILEREGPEARIVVWAHNDHVATQPGQMGWHLRRMFGPDLLTVGFAFNRGSFQTMQLHPLQGGTLRAFTVGPAPAGSFDGTLAAAGLTLAAVDLRRIPDDGPAHRWFTSARATHSIGGGYLEADDMSFRGLSARQVLPSHYDAILFVDTTTAARPTASGQVRPRAILEAPRNLGFEEGPPGDTPPGWEPPTRLAGVLYQAATSVERPSSGARCAVIRRLPGERYSEVGGSLVQQVAAGPYRGRSIAVGAAARVEPSASGDHAYLWVRVHGPGRRVQDLGVVRIAGADWQRYEIVGDVAADAEMVAFGLYLVGDGAAYLDAVSIAAVDR
jgi:erythromycin esterase